MGFQRLEGETAILQTKGVYRQVDLYSWEGKLFAQVPGGFIRLKMDGSTSKDGVRLELLQYDGPLFRDSFGRLCTTKTEGREALISTPEGIKLLT